MVKISVTVTERYPCSFLFNPMGNMFSTGAENFSLLGKEIINCLEKYTNNILYNIKAKISRIECLNDHGTINPSTPHEYDLLKNYNMENAHVYVEIDCISLKVNDTKFIFNKDEYIIDALEFIARLLDIDRKRFLYNGEPIDYSKIHVCKCFQLQENILTIKNN